MGDSEENEMREQGFSHHRDGNGGGIHEHHRRSDDGNGNGSMRIWVSGLGWHFAAFFLGVVITLIGAWATHSVSRDDLDRAIKNHAESSMGEMKSMKEILDRVESTQLNMVRSQNAQTSDIAVIKSRLGIK